jgi:hypothetical protein
VPIWAFCKGKQRKIKRDKKRIISYKQRVGGSNPSAPTKGPNIIGAFLFLASYKYSQLGILNSISFNIGSSLHRKTNKMLTKRNLKCKNALTFPSPNERGEKWFK